MAFEEELKACVLERFDDAQFVEFGLVESMGKVGGMVTSTRFKGMPQLDRQTELWTALKGRFSPDDLRHVSLILTLTPEELEGLDED